MVRALTLFAVVCLLLAPFTSSAAADPAAGSFFDRTGELTRIPFPALSDLEHALANVPVRPEVFWKDVLALRQMPLVFGDTAVFLYRGEARTVGWIGDFSGWQNGAEIPGRRVGRTDIWMVSKVFASDARLDYRVVVDGGQRLDPLNSLIQQDTYGKNSVLIMPGVVQPTRPGPDEGVAKGKLSEPIIIQSESLGYAKRIQVYTPRAYEQLKDLPVIYMTDGQEFARSDMGAAPVILDNLIARGTIPPVMAVFVDPRAVETGDNRRGPELLTNPRFQGFLTQELIPWIDRRYRTQPSAEARAIVGASLGGLHATYTAIHQARWFGMAGVLSPYYAAKPAVLAEVQKSVRVPVRLFVSQGTYDLDVSNTRHLCRILSAKGYDFQCQESQDGHSWGNWSRVLDDMLVYFFAEAPAGRSAKGPVGTPGSPTDR